MIGVGWRGRLKRPRRIIPRPAAPPNPHTRHPATLDLAETPCATLGAMVDRATGQVQPLTRLSFIQLDQSH